MKVFINYKQKVQPDHRLAAFVERELKKRSHDVFRDETGVIVGEVWPRRIHEEVKACEVMVCLISNNSLKSEWVLNEIDLAKTLATPIIPVLLEQLDEDLEFQAFKPRFMNIQYYQISGKDEADVGQIADRIKQVLPLRRAPRLQVSLQSRVDPFFDSRYKTVSDDSSEYS